MKNSAIDAFLRAKFDGLLFKKKSTINDPEKNCPMLTKNNYFQLNIARLCYMVRQKYKRNIAGLRNQPKLPM
jgi:hypothetical protein